MDKFDLIRLNEALEIIRKVWEYNYFPGRRSTKRLETIIKKLETFIAKEEEKRKLYNEQRRRL